MARQKRNVTPTIAQRGFTLLELAAVLAILSVVVVFGMDIANNAIQGSERLSTQQKLSVIQEALEAYAERNGYLPCPANPALAPSAAAFGIEQRNATVGLGCVAGGGIPAATVGAWIGAVPVRTLGLSENYAEDAWGNKLTYAISLLHDGGAADGGIASYAANTGSIEIRSGNLTTNYIVTSLADGTAAANATYVVLSHGKNGRGAYLMNGSTIGATCNAATLDGTNCDRTDAIFYDAPYNEGSINATAFDDYIVWGSNLRYRNPASLLTNSCPTDPSGTIQLCEVWCAPCTNNVHGSTTVPVTPTRLCNKFITSSNPCEATCVWPGATLPCP